MKMIQSGAWSAGSWKSSLGLKDQNGCARLAKETAYRTRDGRLDYRTGGESDLEWLVEWDGQPNSGHRLDWDPMLLALKQCRT